jgi:hypothetical protein
MQIIGTVIVVLALLAHDIYAQSFGPNTGSQWSTSSGGFAAVDSQRQVPVFAKWNMLSDNYLLDIAHIHCPNSIFSSLVIVRR